MKRFLAVCIVAVAGASSESTSADALKRASDFDKPWILYLRQLAGCPKDISSQVEIDVSRCKPENSTIDFSAFSKARRQAAVVFDFKE